MTTLQHFAGLAALIALAPAALSADAPKPAIGLGATAPKGAVILYDGKSMDAWQKTWKTQDGAMLSGGGDLVSKAEFGDALVHVEFRTPNMPDAKGQAKGNSGVYLQGRYEIQVLDSYGIESPGRGDCGAVYNIAAPLVNASRPPMQWQSYDIAFRAPRIDAAGKKTENARVTVFQNGILVQNNTEIPYPTAAGMGADEFRAGPLLLQDHGNTVFYRNVWFLPLPLSGADHY